MEELTLTVPSDVGRPPRPRGAQGARRHAGRRRTSRPAPATSRCTCEFEPGTIGAAAHRRELSPRPATSGRRPGRRRPAERQGRLDATDGSRATTTNPVDAAMSGDYRKY